jgi:ubiquinone biosynthesis protein UbiJ
MRLDPADLPGAIANRFLERETWARQRLSAHAGRGFVLAVGPVATALAVDASGMVQSTLLSGRATDLTLAVSPLDLPAFLAEPARWDRYVESRGDPALAATLKELAQTLPWFVEQAFAKALGPIVGQQVAAAGRRLLGFPEYAALRVSDSVASYASDEAGLIVRGDEARTFAGEVAALSARVEACGARVEALERRSIATTLKRAR